MAEVASLNPVNQSSADPLSWLGNLVNVFDNGLSAYVSAQERLKALKRINNDTVTTAAPSVAAPKTAEEETLLGQAKSALKNSVVGFAAAGILGIILLLMIFKKRR